MSTLDGLRVAVIGGAGAVGVGISRAFLEAGATVAVTSREPSRVERIRASLGEGAHRRLHAVRGRLDDPASARSLRDGVVDALGGLDAVVASIGGWWSGPPVLEVGPDTWRAVMDERLTTHLNCVQAFVPELVTGGGSYTMIGGGAGTSPIAGSGPVSVAGAAQIMLGEVLFVENPGARIHTLVLEAPIATYRTPDAPDRWLTADEVGGVCVYLASPDGAGSARRTLRIGSRPQLLEFLGRGGR